MGFHGGEATTSLAAGSHGGATGCVGLMTPDFCSNPGFTGLPATG
jgi:hypothetical protein